MPELKMDIIITLTTFIAVLVVLLIALIKHQRQSDHKFGDYVISILYILAIVAQLGGIIMYVLVASDKAVKDRYDAHQIETNFQHLNQEIIQMNAALQTLENSYAELNTTAHENEKSVKSLILQREPRPQPTQESNTSL